MRTIRSPTASQHARQGEDEVVWCFDLESGERQWRQSYPVPFKMGSNGQLWVIAAREDRFEKVASYRVAPSDTYAPPVLAHDGVLIKDKQSLTFWSLRDPVNSLP